MIWRWVRDTARQSFWVIPAVCVCAAAGLALVGVEIDEGLQREGGGIAFTGGPDSARSLLNTIASSMLSLTALVFSITVVVLQLASSQFSPRVMRTFLHDRQTQLTLGIFVATFVYALIALREVRGDDGVVDQFIPGITITGAFALVLLSIGMFVAYIHHIANSIRVITVATRIRQETEAAIEHVAPRDAEPVPLPAVDERARHIVIAHRSGVVRAVNHARLVRLAAEADVLVQLVPRIGDYVPQGAPLMRIVPATKTIDEDPLRDAVDLDAERDTPQDIAFGMRQLVDIAERALSPGVNDPTTAVQCIDQLHTLLRLLGTRPLPSGAHADDQGVVRLVVIPTSWDEYVELACEEIGHWGADGLQVPRRLRGMLRDLLDVVDPERRPPVLRQLALLDVRAMERSDGEMPADTRSGRRGASDPRGT